MNKQKQEFVIKASLEILSAHLVEYEITLNKRQGYVPKKLALISQSINDAEALYKALAEKGYFEPDQDQ
jgi:hypothetical protein